MNPTAKQPPAFCPSCGRSFRSPARGLCDECGAGLADQGYCPVCEGFLAARVGDFCPKHDLPLEAGPAPPRDDAEGPWVEVARFDDAVACHPPRIRLEAEGIPTEVEGELAGSKSIHAAFSGGVVLRVPESLAADARVILSQRWSEDAETLGVEEPVDWDDVDEDFGSSATRDSNPAGSLAIRYIALEAILLAILLALAVLGR